MHREVLAYLATLSPGYLVALWPSRRNAVLMQCCHLCLPCSTRSRSAKEPLFEQLQCSTGVPSLRHPKPNCVSCCAYVRSCRSNGKGHGSVMERDTRQAKVCARLSESEPLLPVTQLCAVRTAATIDGTEKCACCLASEGEECLRNSPLLKLLRLHRFRRGGCAAEGGGWSESSTFGLTVRVGWGQTVGTGWFFFGGGGGDFYMC